MSRKLPRLLFVASLVAGASLAPMLGAYAQDTRGIDIEDDRFGARGTANDAGETQVYKSDDVVWTVLNGEHTVTPEDPAKWGGSEGSPTLKAGESFKFQFTIPGTYAYYCEIHGRQKMSGKVIVMDPNAPAPPPPPASSSTTTTRAAPPTTTTRPVVTTTAPPATSAGSKTPTTAAPATTTTAAPKEKDRDRDKGRDKKAKQDEETTTTTAPPPPPIDLPNEAIVPSLPGFGPTGTTTQGGVEAPDGTPEGDAVALLKSGGGRGGNAKKLLIVSGVGLGALGFGTAGYKYANRSSKYFPA